MKHVKCHLNGDMKGHNGSRIRDVKLFNLKYVVFGAYDIDNNLNINRRGYIYTIDKVTNVKFTYFENNLRLTTGEGNGHFYD